MSDIKSLVVTAGITGVWGALRDSDALPPHDGALPQPQDGIQNAMIAWAQVDCLTIVDSDRFFPLYLAISGGDQARNRQNRTGIQYGDQFLQDIMPHANFRPGIPILSDLIHPTFRIETTFGLCQCRDIKETIVADEKWASVNLDFPRIDLQRSLDTYANENQVSNCPICNQIRRESVRRQLVHATPIIAVTIARIQQDTGQRIQDLVTVPVEVEIPVVDRALPARFTLKSAILPTASAHFVSLLRSRNGQYIRVSDAHIPTVAGRNEIRKAEIYIYGRVSVHEE